VEQIGIYGIDQKETLLKYKI